MKVVVNAVITDASIQIVDAPQEEDKDLAIRVEFPNKREDVGRANPLQHVLISFRAKAAGKPIQVHQASVIFTNVETQHEIIFATKAVGKAYKLHLVCVSLLFHTPLPPSALL